MNKISQKQINDAARQHAQKMLGTQQFKTNPSARSVIQDDFKAGVTFLINFQKTSDGTNK